MFVVRLELPNGESDFKAFSARVGANLRFERGDRLTSQDRLEGAALFEVPGINDPRAAIEAVKNGNAILLKRDLRWQVDRSAEEFIDELIRAGVLPLPKDGNA
jgi:hypothetical protein